MKKTISLFLVFSILMLSGNIFSKDFAKARKGPDVIIQKKDGTQIRGELIAVKEDSLLLLERGLGADASIYISEIKAIDVKKRSEALLGGAVGLLAGAGSAAIYVSSREWSALELGQPAYESIAIALATTLFGVLIGASFGGEERIKIEGKSEAQIQEILAKLRKKARVKNYK